MGTPFMIDAESIATLQALRATAEANPYTEQDMRAMMDRMRVGITEPDRQRNSAQTVELPFGYTVTFTHEWQPMGTCRHVSMASPNVGRIPIDAAMEMMIPHLGFVEGAERQGWAEHLEDGRIAYNLVEVIEPENDTMAKQIFNYGEAAH